MTDVLQSFIAGRWIGRQPAQELHSAVNGRRVAATHAEPVDFAEALDHAAASTMDFGKAANRAKAWSQIWGSGQGIGAVRAITPAAGLVDRLAREYAEAKRTLCAG